MLLRVSWIFKLIMPWGILFFFLASRLFSALGLQRRFLNWIMRENYVFFSSCISDEICMMAARWRFISFLAWFMQWMEFRCIFHCFAHQRIIARAERCVIILFRFISILLISIKKNYSIFILCTILKIWFFGLFFIKKRKRKIRELLLYVFIIRIFLCRL